MQWITDLAAAYPTNSEVVSAGKSVEGRDIKGIHIWGSGGKGSQKAVVWHGTVHAREWITTMYVRLASSQKCFPEGVKLTMISGLSSTPRTSS